LPVVLLWENHRCRLEKIRRLNRNNGLIKKS
jgi:hypothetical protein